MRAPAGSPRPLPPSSTPLGDSFVAAPSATVAATLVAACGVDTAPAAAPRATWYQDVAPILAQRCMGCHQDGGIAPFALTDVADVKDNATRALAQIEAGTMPPFDAREEADCTPRFGRRWNNTIQNPFVQRMLNDSHLPPTPIDVALGEQTTDEMCLEIFGLAPLVPAALVADPSRTTLPAELAGLRLR